MKSTLYYTNFGETGSNQQGTSQFSASLPRHPMKQHARHDITLSHHNVEKRPGVLCELLSSPGCNRMTQGMWRPPPREWITIRAPNPPPHPCCWWHQRGWAQREETKTRPTERSYNSWLTRQWASGSLPRRGWLTRSRTQFTVEKKKQALRTRLWTTCATSGSVILPSWFL